MSEYIYGTDGHEGHWLTGEEIVRCRDCRFYKSGDSGRWCLRSISMKSNHPDGYCAWGKIKERIES